MRFMLATDYNLEDERKSKLPPEENYPKDSVFSVSASKSCKRAGLPRQAPTAR